MSLDGPFEVIRNGRIEGPFSLVELQAMQLSGTDFVKPQGYADFKELREIKELSTVLRVKFEEIKPQYFATLDMRLLSAVIDYVIVTVLYSLIALLWLLAIGAQQPAVIRALLLGIVIIPGIRFLISVYTESSVKQATPGKMAVGIKVCLTNGGRIGPGRAAARNLAKLTGVFTLGIGFFSGFFDPKQQCLHDKIAGTCVIRDRLI